MMHSNGESEFTASGVSIFEIGCVLKNYRYIVLGCILAGFLLSVVLVLVMTPTYRAEVQVVPVSEKDSGSRFAAQLGELGGLAALSGINVNQGGKKNESIATLRSRKLTTQFIEKENLLPVLFADQWDDEKQEWTTVQAEDIPSLEDAWRLFDREIRALSEDRGSGLVVLSIDWRDPQQAAKWANELISMANENLRIEAATESEKAIEYLREQSGKTSIVELQEVINRLIESEMKKVILAHITKEYAFRVIDPAIAPEEPFRPKPLSMTVLGAAFGAVFGVVLVFVLNASQRRQVGHG